MQTEAIRVALRLRTPWEAVDLGVSMVRTWWLPIMASWLALFVPVVLAAWLLAPTTTLAMFVIWWLKPLFDRAVLNVLAQGVFGPVPRWSDTLGSLPGLALRSGLLLSLGVLRLSPQRSLTLPILQLENLRGRAYSRRARTLSGRDIATAMGLTVLCSALEFVVILGAMLLAVNLMTDPMGGDSFDLDAWLEAFDAPGWSIPLYALAITLVEPFYVGGGFGLYLNRRIELEGWDIEVAFRAIARRHERSFAMRTASFLAVGVLSCSALLLAASTARAAEPLRCAAENPADASACIDRVFAGAEFDRSQQQGGWRLRSWVRDFFGAGTPEKNEAPWELGVAIGSALASILRTLAWVALIFGGLALAGALARYWVTRRRPTSAPDAAPAQQIQEARKELPPDVASAALARWAVDPVAALGLLYAGGRAHLIQRLGLALPDGATERECERVARRHGRGPLVDDFGTLTRAWVYCAYAQRLPSAESFRELCERWRNHLVSA